MKIRYYTFGVDHPLAGYVQKIVTTDDSDPRNKMLAAYGTNWCWEYLPEHDTIIENGDGTVTFVVTSKFSGTSRSYTYKLIEKVL